MLLLLLFLPPLSMIPEVALTAGLEAVTADGFRLMVVWFTMMEAVWFTLMKAVWFTLRLAVAVWFALMADVSFTLLTS